jgi:hypothetical protein
LRVSVQLCVFTVLRYLRSNLLCAPHGLIESDAAVLSQNR